jgi:hypothetical protein
MTIAQRKQTKGGWTVRNGSSCDIKTSTDSGPGLDVKPYITYKKLWSIVGAFILNSWKHCCSTSVLPAWHSDSLISLLPMGTKNIKSGDK